MKIKALSASIEDCIKIISAKSLDHRRVYYLTEKQKVPYDPGAETLHNHEVDLFGTKALCVGIQSVGTDTTHKAPLVSDSFAPCVPVVAIGRTGTHLAHFNGTGSVDKFSAQWLKTHRLFVIQKLHNAKQTLVSDGIVKR